MVDGFNVPVLPAQLPPFVAGTLWEPTDGETLLQVRMSIIGPDNQARGSVVEVPEQNFSGSNRHRVNVNFQGIPISVPGAYAVRIEQKRGNEWVEEGLVPLIVNYVPPQVQFEMQQSNADSPIG